MPITRYFINRDMNEAKSLAWGPYSVSCDYTTVRYDEVNEVRMQLMHRTHSTNFVKNDDTISYVIMIDDIVLARAHSAFNRITSNAKEIGNEIVREYEGHIRGIYRYIVPGLFKRKAEELLVRGKVEIAGMVFGKDGTVVIEGAKHRVADLDFALSNGQWYVFSRAKKTLFGNPKRVATISSGEANACLIEPMVNLLKSM